MWEITEVTNISESPIPQIIEHTEEKNFTQFTFIELSQDAADNKNTKGLKNQLDKSPEQKSSKGY